MLTRRNFFVILIMFLVVFVMFMSVDISAGYLTRREYNPQADIPVTSFSEFFIIQPDTGGSAPASPDRP